MSLRKAVRDVERKGERLFYDQLNYARAQNKLGMKALEKQLEFDILRGALNSVGLGNVLLNPIYDTYDISLYRNLGTWGDFGTLYNYGGSYFLRDDIGRLFMLENFCLENVALCIPGIYQSFFDTTTFITTHTINTSVSISKLDHEDAKYAVVAATLYTLMKNSYDENFIEKALQNMDAPVGRNFFEQYPFVANGNIKFIAMYAMYIAYRMSNYDGFKEPLAMGNDSRRLKFDEAMNITKKIIAEAGLTLSLVDDGLPYWAMYSNHAFGGIALPNQAYYAQPANQIKDSVQKKNKKITNEFFNYVESQFKKNYVNKK
jgi:uncharacterized protein YlaN (UPF0358 family)